MQGKGTFVFLGLNSFKGKQDPTKTYFSANLLQGAEVFKVFLQEGQEVLFSDAQQYDEFEIDYDKIREEFSRIASNSWVKCKKKLIIEKDYNPYIAKKSLFHSLRILMFGIQIMKLGKIVDFSEANIYYKDIMDSPNDWEYLKEKYQPIYNKLKSEFRLEHSKLK
jgi:hypothetical protein